MKHTRHLLFSVLCYHFSRRNHWLIFKYRYIYNKKWTLEHLPAVRLPTLWLFKSTSKTEQEKIRYFWSWQLYFKIPGIFQVCILNVHVSLLWRVFTQFFTNETAKLERFKINIPFKGELFASWAKWTEHLHSFQHTTTTNINKHKHILLLIHTNPVITLAHIVPYVTKLVRFLSHLPPAL